VRDDLNAQALRARGPIASQSCVIDRGDGSSAGTSDASGHFMMKKLMLLGTLPLLVACVSQAKYDAALASADQARAGNDRALKLAKRLAVEKSQLQDALDSAEARCKEVHDQYEGTLAATRACRAALDGATAINAGLSTELTNLGKDADALLTERGALASSLAQARARLEELRRAQASSEARAALFRDLALKLKRMVDAGDLQILLRNGRMVLVLPNDVLFDSGQTRLKPAGRAALERIATVLRTLERRQFQVAGHTDDQPIRVSPFGSNWELSVARALEVVKVLIANGMDPRALSAAGYGEFDPTDSNESASGKAHNRRTEITLQPNIDDLVIVPETK
jgi:chemotaxis protein MotB